MAYSYLYIHEWNTMKCDSNEFQQFNTTFKAFWNADFSALKYMYCYIKWTDKKLGLHCFKKIHLTNKFLWIVLVDKIPYLITHYWLIIFLSDTTHLINKVFIHTRVQRLFPIAKRFWLITTFQKLGLPL